MPLNGCKITRKKVCSKNWNNFCAWGLFFLTISQSVSAQQTDSMSVKKNPSILFFKSNPAFHFSLNTFPAPAPVKISPMQHWGIMCIGEYRLEQKTGIPLRLRLGSLEYVNKLEGKH